MTEWREVALEDLAAEVPNALATGPFGSAISARYFTDDGVPVLRGSNLSFDVGARLIDDDLAFVTEDKALQFKRSIARCGDLVFTCWGSVGQVGLVDENARFDAYVVSNKQMKLTPDPRTTDSRFLYYLLSDAAMVGEVKNQAIGSAVPGFNLGQLRELRVQVPQLQVQRRIADLLESFDNLIKNDRRRIEVLEETARSLYREWFVRFRFPGHESAEFVDSAVGVVPMGWRVTALGNLIELRYGKALKSTARRGGAIPVVGSSGIVGFHDEALVKGPGIVVGRKGHVGSVIWVHSDFFPIDTTYFVVSDRPMVWLRYLLEHLTFQNSHAAVPGLNRDDALSIEVVEPQASLVDRFVSAISPLLDLVDALENVVSHTARARDLLLPKLVTGSIDVESLGVDDVFGWTELATEAASVSP